MSEGPDLDLLAQNHWLSESDLKHKIRIISEELFVGVSLN